MLAIRGASWRSCGVGPMALSGSRPVAAGTPVEPAAASANSPRTDRAHGEMSRRHGWDLEDLGDMLRVGFPKTMLAASLTSLQPGWQSGCRPRRRARLKR